MRSCLLSLPRRRLRPARSRGAALLLVLMLIPALSLLGTSLLSQVTLEGDRVLAQFEDAQAFHYAEAGLRRAAWALETLGQLESVGQSLPTGVIACTATQGSQTAGGVDWWGGSIAISSTGRCGRSQRTLSAQFAVSPAESIIDLKNVITSGGLVTVLSPNPPMVYSTVNGKVLSGDPATSLCSVLGNHPVTITTVPALAIQAKVADILSRFPSTIVTGAQLDASTPCNPFDFVGGVSIPGVYYTNDPGIFVPTTNYTPGCIEVHDECIWLIENGAAFGKDFSIVGDSYDDRLLILVTEDPCTGKGWWANKGFATSNVSVVALTDGYYHWDKECILAAVSLYTSDHFWAAKGQDFYYCPTALDAWIDGLGPRGLVPSVAGTSGLGTLSMSAGTFTQSYGP